MTVEEIENKIEELEDKKYLLELKENSLYEHFHKFDEYCLEVKVLKEKLNKAKNKFKKVKLEDLGIGD